VKCKTQKLVFFAIAAVSCLLLTCAPFAAGDYGESGGGITYTDVEYSPDGRSITVYLDGSKPVRQSRALNLNNAKYGHDLFEVAFYRSGTTPARAVWEKGQAAGVNGVARNVDYRYANIPAIIPDGGSPLIKYGAAIIFVGKKSDKTLLAVGKLTGTSDSSDSGSNTLITENTRSVTFSVYAFNSGTSDDPENSSFYTAALRNGGDGTPLENAVETTTDVTSIMFGKFVFPLYRLNKNQITDNQVIDAAYWFDVYSGDFDDFHGGILQYQSPYNYQSISYTGPSLATMEDAHRLGPRYPRGDGSWEYDILPLLKDTSTGLTITSTSPNGDGSFQNPVKFKFTSPKSMNNRIFAFSFQVPVFPLTNLDDRGLHDPWFLRPGYDSHWYDLDNGEGGNGGAILIGTGNIENSLDFDISIVRSPIKKFYGPNAPEPKWTFSLDGIRVDYIAGNSNFSYVVEPLYLVPGVPADIKDHRVSFYIGSVDPSNEILEGQSLQSFLTVGGDGVTPSAVVDENGEINVIVVFDVFGDGSKYYPKSFVIYFLGGGFIAPPDSGSILPQNRKIIASTDDLQTFSNTPLNGGNYLLVFFDSYDLDQIILNGNSTIVLIAAAPGVVLGRSATATNAVFQINNSGNTSFLYLGLWPFSDALVVDGIPITNHPLTINAAGSCLSPYPADHALGYFINSQSTNITVTRGPGLIVHNPGRFDGP
jgi:hypothetical protein